MKKSNQSENQSEEIKSMIEDHIENKVDKSSIELNQEVLDKIRSMKEDGESKDDISFEVIVNFKMKNSLFDIHWKSLQQSQSYRDKTIEMFLERIDDVENFKLKDWTDEMIKGGYLTKTENYKQHFIVYKSLFLRKNLMRVEGYKI